MLGNTRDRGSRPTHRLRVRNGRHRHVAPLRRCGRRSGRRARRSRARWARARLPLRARLRPGGIVLQRIGEPRRAPVGRRLRRKFLPSPARSGAVRALRGARTSPERIRTDHETWAGQQPGGITRPSRRRTVRGWPGCRTGGPEHREGAIPNMEAVSVAHAATRSMGIS